MAKSTFLQLCQSTRSECGISSAGPPSVVAQSGILEKVVNWVSYADQETQGRWNNWDFMHVTGWSTATEVGIADVPAPTSLGTWDGGSIYLDSSLSTYKKLTEVGYKVWRDTMRQGVKTNKTPDFVAIMPSQALKLEPPPSAIQTLSADYWKRPVKMVNNGDTSPIPEEYERIIVSRAVMLYAIDHGATDLLVAAQVEYDDILDKLEAKYLPWQAGRRLSDGGTMVVVTV